MKRRWRRSQTRGRKIAARWVGWDGWDGWDEWRDRKPGAGSSGYAGLELQLDGIEKSANLFKTHRLAEEAGGVAGGDEGVLPLDHARHEHYPGTRVSAEQGVADGDSVAARHEDIQQDEI